MDNNRIKVAKIANSKALMDAMANLWFYRHNNRYNEDVYDGSISLAITLPGEKQGQNYAKAYLSKSASKLVFKSIIDRTFYAIFGKDGFFDETGTREGANGCRARTLRINVRKDKEGELEYVFSIFEGAGAISGNGRIDMVGKPDKKIFAYFNHIEVMKFAHEVYDFIRDAELKAYLEGKPLRTIMSHQNNYSQTHRSEFPTQGVTAPLYTLPMKVLTSKFQEASEDNSRSGEAEAILVEMQRRMTVNIQNE